jgi:hypothetical protein
VHHEQCRGAGAAVTVVAGVFSAGHWVGRSPLCGDYMFGYYFLGEYGAVLTMLDNFRFVLFNQLTGGD